MPPKLQSLATSIARVPVLSRLVVPSLLLSVAVLGVSACGSNESSKGSKELMTCDVKQDRLLAILPMAGSEIYTSVGWYVQKSDGSKIDAVSPPYGTRLTPNDTQTIPQPLIRHGKEGSIDVIIPAGQYSVPADWEFLVVHVREWRRTDGGKVRIEADLNTSMRFDNPNDGPSIDLSKR